MSKFIQIRGSMGTGKTTAVRQYLQLTGNFTLHQITVQGKQYPFYHNSHNNTVVTGIYGRRMADGLDGVIDDRNVMMAYLLKIVDTVHPDFVVFEAIMYGTTFLFGQELAEELKKRDMEYEGLVFCPPYEFTVSNILQRNGGKPIKFKALSQKWQQVKRSAEKLQEAGYNIKFVDTSRVRVNDMHYLIEKELV